MLRISIVKVRQFLISIWHSLKTPPAEKVAGRQIRRRSRTPDQESQATIREKQTQEGKGFVMKLFLAFCL